MENRKMELAQIMLGITALLVAFAAIDGYTLTPSRLSTPNWYSVARDIVSLFYVPLFFAVGGFLFGCGESHAERHPQSTIKQKLLSLWLPCVFFAFLYFFVERPLPSILDMRLVDFLLAIFFYPPFTIAEVYPLVFILLFLLIVFARIKNNKIARVALLGIFLLLAFFTGGGIGVAIGSSPLCFALAMIAGQKYEALKKRKGLVLKAMAAFALFFYTFAVFCCASPESLRLPKSYNLFARIFAGLLLAGGISLPALASLGLQRIRFARRFFFVCCRLLVANLPSSSAFHEGDTEDHRRAMALVP